MHNKLLNETDGQRTYALVFQTGDSVMGPLKAFAAEHRVAAAQISGIGAFQDAVLKYFDWDLKRYIDIPVREQVEVASFIGDVALAPDGKPEVHAHLVVAHRDGTAKAGHLGDATVRPTLELIVTEQPAHLHKRFDPQSGLALIRAEL